MCEKEDTQEYEKEMDNLLLELFEKWRDTNEYIYDLNMGKQKAIITFLGDVKERLEELIEE